MAHVIQWSWLLLSFEGVRETLMSGYQSGDTLRMKTRVKATVARQGLCSRGTSLSRGRMRNTSFLLGFVPNCVQMPAMCSPEHCSSHSVVLTVCRFPDSWCLAKCLVTSFDSRISDHISEPTQLCTKASLVDLTWKQLHL